MEPTNIQRVVPRTAIPNRATRRARERRQRDQEESSFSEELSREAVLPAEDSAQEHREERPVAPPEDDEAGTRIDLVG